MARTGVVVCVLAVVAVGGYAAVPDDEPDYLGDMPSIIEQAEAAPPPPGEFVPAPEAAQGPPVDGPDPVALEAPPPIPAVQGEHLPAPVTDAVGDFDPNASDNGTTGPRPLLDPSDVLPTDLCIGADEILRPGQGLFDCATGELLQIDDPAVCEIGLPLRQLGCLPD